MQYGLHILKTLALSRQCRRLYHMIAASTCNYRSNLHTVMAQMRQAQAGHQFQLALLAEYLGPLCMRESAQPSPLASFRSLQLCWDVHFSLPYYSFDKCFSSSRSPLQRLQRPAAAAVAPRWQVTSHKIASH